MVNGLSGERMLIGLAIGIAVLIFLVLKTKVQALICLYGKGSAPNRLTVHRQPILTWGSFPP